MKVWSGSTGKVVGFNNFDDLISKVREKFNLGEERVKLALADGCEVDDDDGLFAIPNMTDLYLYKETEIPGPSGTCNLKRESETERIDFILESLKKRRTDSSKVKKESLTLKVTLGWMHFNCKEKRHIMVRTQKGGGTRTAELLRKATYEEILTKMKDLFFPNGKSPVGRLAKFNCRLGDPNGNIIPPTNFDFGVVIGRFEKSVKLYLMTKEKTFTVETDTSSEDDFELPEINFRSQVRNQVLTTQASIGNMAAFTSGLGTQAATGNGSPSSRGSPSTSTSAPAAAGILVQTGTPTVQFNIQPSICEICQTNEKSHFLVPCGHTFCNQCASQLTQQGRPCAYCRQNFIKVNPLYT